MYNKKDCFSHLCKEIGYQNIVVQQMIVPSIVMLMSLMGKIRACIEKCSGF